MAPKKQFPPPPPPPPAPKKRGRKKAVREEEEVQEYSPEDFLGTGAAEVALVKLDKDREKTDEEPEPEPTEEEGTDDIRSIAIEDPAAAVAAGAGELSSSSQAAQVFGVGGPAVACCCCCPRVTGPASAPTPSESSAEDMGLVMSAFFQNDHGINVIDAIQQQTKVQMRIFQQLERLATAIERFMDDGNDGVSDIASSTGKD